MKTIGDSSDDAFMARRRVLAAILMWTPIAFAVAGCGPADMGTIKPPNGSPGKEQHARPEPPPKEPRRDG
jgi:hypothetical protein